MGRDGGVEGRASSSRGVALLVATAARKGARARACARAPRMEREGGQRQPREAVVQRDLVLRARRAEGWRERERQRERQREREEVCE